MINVRALQNNVKLMDFITPNGDGFKIEPSVLDDLLITNENFFSNSLSSDDFSHRDDSAIIDRGLYFDLLNTHFFSPIVNDPFTFGQAAAAAALNAVYAMGGRPEYVTTVLAFPLGVLPLDTVKMMVQGGKDVLDRCLTTNVGGHTIKNAQPLMGLSVVGSVARHHLKTHQGAREGDVVILTRPLGNGILSNAEKLGLLQSPQREVLHQSVTALNVIGETLGGLPDIHAMTHVTDLGLIGHLMNMLSENRLHVSLSYQSLLWLENSIELSHQVLLPQGLADKNHQRYWEAVDYQVSYEKQCQLNDPQTNGGLLIAVSPNKTNEVLSLLNQDEYSTPIVLGTLEQANLDQPFTVTVTP